jgi:hypothetical protein
LEAPRLCSRLAYRPDIWIPALTPLCGLCRATANSTGYWKFGAREGKHDDLVLALAVALWRSAGASSNRGMLDYWRELSRAAMG